MNRIKRFDSYSNTFLDIDRQDRIQKSIFVSIVSYKDKNVLRTLESMILNSQRPNNVFFGVSIAHENEEWIEKIKLINKENKNLNISLITDNSDVTYGILKKNSDSFYNKEDYYLSVSSSSEFDPDWDDILIKQYESLAALVDGKVAITGEPRGWLPHDNVVKDYVYFTNHKTNVSMQREQVDSSYIPISGYHEHINDKDIEEAAALSATHQNSRNYITNLYEYSNFFENNGFVKFYRRKFLDDEFLARSLGISANFIFSYAKDYLKSNVAQIYLLDEEDFNFISFLNLLDNDYDVFSFRYLPIYHLYDDKEILSPRRDKVSDRYTYNKNLSEEELNEKIKFYRDPILDRISSLEKIDEARKIFYYYLFSCDWNLRKFRIRRNKMKNSIENTINTYVSMYNFSINENSLHWNKIDR